VSLLQAAGLNPVRPPPLLLAPYRACLPLLAVVGLPASHRPLSSHLDSPQIHLREYVRLKLGVNIPSLLVRPTPLTPRTRGGVSAGCRYARRVDEGRQGYQRRRTARRPPYAVSPPPILLASRQPADTPPLVRRAESRGKHTIAASSTYVSNPTYSRWVASGGGSAGGRDARRGGRGEIVIAATAGKAIRPPCAVLRLPSPPLYAQRHDTYTQQRLKRRGAEWLGVVDRRAVEMRVSSPRILTARRYTTASTWGGRGRPNEWRQR